MGGWDDWDSDEAEEPEPSANLPIPWEQDDYGDVPEETPARPRHDAFTPARRAAFLKRLSRTGCLSDAAKRTGVTARTVYNHQDKDEAFARHCALAIRMAAGGIELIAWQRAVEGVDQQFACGGQVHTRTRYSDSLLRLFLQAADPKKYGARPGFTRKRLMAWERKQLEKEVEAKFLATQRVSERDLADEILRKLDVLDRRTEPDRLAAGWVRDQEGNWIPPGWVRAEAIPPEGTGDGPPAIP